MKISDNSHTTLQMQYEFHIMKYVHTNIFHFLAFYYKTILGEVKQVLINSNFRKYISNYLSGNIKKFNT